MPFTAIHIKNDRSLADISFPVHKLTVFVGKNDVGKANLWIVTHSEQLTVQLGEETGIIPREVIRCSDQNIGATWIKGLTLTGEF